MNSELDNAIKSAIRSKNREIERVQLEIENQVLREENLRLKADVLVFSEMLKQFIPDKPVKRTWWWDLK